MSMNIGTHSGNNGFDISEFDIMINQLEKMGIDTAQIAENVLDAGSEPARQAFIRNMRPNSKRDKEHARDNVVVSKTRIARKTKNRYRLVGTLNRNFEYLYYVENGTTQAPPHPFIEKAYRAARDATVEPMKEAYNREFDKNMGG